jgi:hypothetical protein
VIGVSGGIIRRAEWRRSCANVSAGRYGTYVIGVEGCARWQEAPIERPAAADARARDMARNRRHSVFGCNKDPTKHRNLNHEGSCQALVAPTSSSTNNWILARWVDAAATEGSSIPRRTVG